MIPLESPVPEIGTPGSESGERKRAHGIRTAARRESAGRATAPYRLRASPRLYYRIPAGPAGITLAAYYNAQQGRPYSYLDGSDSNGDGTRGNDLLYVPRSADEVVVTDGAFDDLMRFLSDGCDVTPGQPSCRATPAAGPGYTRVRLPRGRRRADGPEREWRSSLDVQNLVNMFGSANGLVEFAFFQNMQPVQSSVDPETGRYVYSLNSPARPGFTGDRFTRVTICGAAGRRSSACATRSGGRPGLIPPESAGSPKRHPID